MAIDVEATRLLVYNSARLRDAGLPFLTEAAMCKVYSSEVAERVASMADQPVRRQRLREGVSGREALSRREDRQIYEGTTNMQLMTIAKDLLGVRALRLQLASAAQRRITCSVRASRERRSSKSAARVARRRLRRESPHRRRVCAAFAANACARVDRIVGVLAAIQHLRRARRSAAAPRRLRSRRRRTPSAAPSRRGRA